jgi:uncharacterized membrane protein
MGNNYFDPIGLHVEPGTMVRFEIKAGAHSATAYPERIPTDADTFDSETISRGSFDHTFETPGTYDYYCTPHRSVGMVGRIVVGQPGGPAGDSPIPDGDVPASQTIVEQGSVPYGSSSGTGSSRTNEDGMMGFGGRGDGMGGGMGGSNTGVGRGSLVGVFGGLVAMLGVAGGAVYWLTRRGDADTETGSDSAMDALQMRHARGELSDEEFESRLTSLRQRGLN